MGMCESGRECAAVKASWAARETKQLIEKLYAQRLLREARAVLLRWMDCIDVVTDDKALASDTEAFLARSAEFEPKAEEQEEGK